MNGMTRVIHYPSLSCARVMHFPSAFHVCSVSGCIVSEIGTDTHVSMCTKEVMLASMPVYNLDGSLTGRDFLSDVHFLDLGWGGRHV